MPLNRVSDCRASEATRNEGKPDPPTMKRNEGMEKTTMKTPKEEYRYGIEVLMYDNTIDDNRVCFFGVGQQFAFKAPKDYCGIGTICNYTPVDSTGEYGDVSRETLIDGHSYVVRYDGMDEHANEIIRAVDLNEQGEDSGKDALGGKIMNCLLIFALQMSMTASVMANEWIDSDSQYRWKYEQTNGCVCLTKGPNAKRALTIPSTIVGCPVTEIGEKAFYGCIALTDVTIPGSVTNIGSSAFYGCSNLSNVTIPGGVTGIEENAFYGCTALSDVTVPSSVAYVGDSAFYGCNALTGITINSKATIIRDYAFAHCDNLVNVELPFTVFTNCASSAFNESKNIIVHVELNNGKKVDLDYGHLDRSRKLYLPSSTWEKDLIYYLLFQTYRDNIDYKFTAHDICPAHPALYKDFCAGASEVWCEQRKVEMREMNEQFTAWFEYDEKLKILTAVTVDFEDPGVSIEALEAKYKKKAKGNFWKNHKVVKELFRADMDGRTKVNISMGDDEISVSGIAVASYFHPKSPRCGRITIRSRKLDAALAERDRQENEAKARAEADAARKKESETLNF